jgi:site-specific recombinase XerD
VDERYRLHDLRAQHAVALLRQGEDIETVRKALRHASITTTARYLRHVEGHVAGSVRRLRFPAAAL